MSKIQNNQDVDYEEQKQKALAKIQELQAYNKNKFDFDISQLEKDSPFRQIYMKLISHTRQTKDLSAWIIDYVQVLETKVTTLQEEVDELSQIKNNQPDQGKGDSQALKNDPSQDNINNNNNNNNQDINQSKGLSIMDQSLKASQKNLPREGSDGVNNQNMMNVSMKNGGIDERDRIIEELKQALHAKEQDLMIAAEIEEEHKQLQEAIHYLEKENQDLKNQFGLTMQTKQVDLNENSRLKDQIEHLGRQNQFFCEQYELLKQKADQQDTTLEYLVAENSRLIIKSFAATDRKYKV